MPVPTRAPRRLVLATGTAAGLGLCCAVAMLLWPRMGTDLSAAFAHADFATAHGLRPVDFRWYGGTEQFGYSLISQYVMSVVGVLLTGVVSALVCSVAFAAILSHCRVRRPVLAGAAGTLCIFANLVSGRITYALGIAFGMVALLALVTHRRTRAGVLAVLSAAASPVSGLFVGLVGAALLLSGRRADGRLLALSAGVPLVFEAFVFGQGGYNTISWSDASSSLVLCLAVLVMCRYRPVRWGAAMCAAGLLATYVVHTPVGLNATRLPVMFAVPVIFATARMRLPWLLVPLLLLTAYRPQLIGADLEDRGSPASTAAYFRPVIAALMARHPVGRVEVPPLRDYWESVYVAEAVPLARGWLRQADTDRNPLFFDRPLTPTTYQAWLVDNGVQYVAVADAVTSHVGTDEAHLIEGGLPYLSQVWTGPHWRLFEVAGDPALADPPARVIAEDASGVTLSLPGPADVVVRVRWTRLLTLSGPDGCVRPDGRWTRLSARKGGTYRLSSALHLGSPARCR